MTTPMHMPPATMPKISHRLICDDDGSAVGAEGRVGCTTGGASEGIGCASGVADVTSGSVGCASDSVGASDGVGSDNSSGSTGASLTMKVPDTPLTSTA